MSLKILLADDSMTAQNMGKKILIDAGYDVVAVSNGAAAIKKIASDRPDIIILDVYMPGYTGLEVCERVKGATETSRTPVLLTVGKMEPFKPEEANRVRADGVMIKPFEATDLIAAIQGIASKMTGLSPAHHEPTVRIAPPMASLDQTMRIAAPQHDDTVRVHAPKGTQSHPAYEETLRLTPEQIRAFQDKSYKDWVASAEVEGDEQPVEETVPETAVAAVAAAEETGPVPLEPVIAPSASILEPLEEVVAAEPEPATPIMPGLDSSESHIARAMAGTMAGHDFFTVTPPPPQATPQAHAEEAPAMYTDAEEAEPETPAQPFFKLSQHAEPEPAEFVAEAPAVMEVEPALETNAPVIPGPSFVSQLEELEPNVAPPVEVVAEAAPELEINSPIHVRQEVEVTTDPALISSDDDMSQFVTKFGKEGAEEVHVGLASDLPPEQLAALTMPQFEPAEREIVQEVPVLEPPDVVVPPMVSLETSEPPVQESPAFLVEPETEPELPLPEVSSTKFSTNVLDEVGSIEPEAALSGTGPTIAYVPSLDDTQPIPPYSEPELAAPVPPVPPITIAPEPFVAAAEPEPIAEAGPVAAIAAESVHEEPSAPPVEEPISAVHMVEAAAAAVVGGSAVAAEAAHFFTLPHSEPVVEASASAIEEPAPTEAFAPAVEAFQLEAALVEPDVESAISVEPEAPAHEPVGDAALAEELAAALDEKEAEERATAAADVAISTAVDPAIAAAVEPVDGIDVHGSADNKLSEAVTRALEKLRPQIIAEILKEMMK